MISKTWDKYVECLTAFCHHLGISVGPFHPIEPIYQKFYPIDVLQLLEYNIVDTEEIRLCIDCGKSWDISDLSRRQPARETLVRNPNNLLSGTYGTTSVFFSLMIHMLTTPKWDTKN